MSDSIDQRMDALAELVLRLSACEYTARAEVSGRRDRVDALAVAMNMLAETLQSEHDARQDAESELEDALEAYENAPGMFCSVAATSFVLLECNNTLAREIDRPKRELLGGSILELIARDDRLAFEAALVALQDGQPLGRSDFELAPDATRRVPVLVSGSRVLDNGVAARIRLIFRNVAQERALESQLRQAQKMDAVGQLAAGVAHDLNNVLAVIAGAGGLLSEHLAPDADLAVEVDAINEAAQRAASLTRQLLTFSRDGATEAQHLELGEFVAGTRRMLERSVADLVHVHIDVEGEPLPVRLDPSQVTQVLLNLAVNARDAMPDGGTLSISTRRVQAQPCDLAEIRVRDDGEGMNPDVLERAFEPFFSTKAPGKGSGLGLAVCFGIVQRGGGTMTIESMPAHGTTVTILFPIDESAPLEQSPATAQSSSGAQGTVLVVDDLAEVRSVIARMLRGRGFEVVEAGGGQEALSRLSELEGDVIVVTDVSMKGMSGAELAHAAWQERPELPVVFVSGYTGDRLDERTTRRPRVRFLGKPFRAEQLVAKIAEAVSERA